jgi:hypothetical protein
MEAAMMARLAGPGLAVPISGREGEDEVGQQIHEGILQGRRHGCNGGALKSGRVLP